MYKRHEPHQGIKGKRAGPGSSNNESSTFGIRWSTHHNGTEGGHASMNNEECMEGVTQTSTKKPEFFLFEGENVNLDVLQINKTTQHKLTVYVSDELYRVLCALKRRGHSFSKVTEAALRHYIKSALKS